jgi:hypothetical protein
MKKLLLAILLSSSFVFAETLPDPDAAARKCYVTQDKEDCKKMGIEMRRAMSGAVKAAHISQDQSSQTE